jgi:probable F420-dependent oxidoreductase
LLVSEHKVVLEADAAKARATARRALRTYLGLPNYVHNWRRLGFTEEDVADGGSNRLVDAVVAWGEPEAIADRLREPADAGADEVAVQVLTGDRGGATTALRTLAPALLG